MGGTVQFVMLGHSRGAIVYHFTMLDGADQQICSLTQLQARSCPYHSMRAHMQLQYHSQAALSTDNVRREIVRYLQEIYRVIVTTAKKADKGIVFTGHGC
jgi:hypothetical protein